MSILLPLLFFFVALSSAHVWAESHSVEPILEKLEELYHSGEEGRRLHKETLLKIARGDEFPGSLLSGIDIVSEEIDYETSVQILEEIWNQDLSNSIVAYFGLLRMDYDPAWEDMKSRLQGNSTQRAHLLNLLARVKTAKTISVVGPYLWDDSIPNQQSSVLSMRNPVKYFALSALSSVVENGPTGPVPSIFVTDDDLEEWQDWWLNRESANDEGSSSALEEHSQKPEDFAVRGSEESSLTAANQKEVDSAKNEIPIEIASPEKSPPLIWPWIVGALILLTALSLILSRKKSQP